MKNVLEYLEKSTHNNPEKICAIYENNKCSYIELMTHAQAIGTFLAKRTIARQPIAVFMDKSTITLKFFMGILYSGCFYSIIDPSFPNERIIQMLNVLKPAIVITTQENKNTLSHTGFSGTIIVTDDVPLDTKDDTLLSKIRNNSTDKDPVYCNFTSGSTGTPKGVLICHRSIINFIDTFIDIFDITCNDVLGNQAPFDFDVSVKDIYSTFASGASLIIIPRSYFMFPNSVTELLDRHKVTTLIWAVSALCLLNRLHGLKHCVPSAINKILFSGEVMPIKQLNAWRMYYPNALFANLYGPTEITCNCTYHIINEALSYDERIPIGIPFENDKVFLLNNDNVEITSKTPNIEGEICVGGNCLSLGYYNNKTATEKSFTDNPLCCNYKETIYRTGDIAYYGDDGLLYFSGRKDFQIKHMGHRIELEEIEHVLNNLPDIRHSCCFFDGNKNKIVAYYVGDTDKKSILDKMKTQLPEYMLPNVFRQIPIIPLTANGKTDRKYIIKIYEDQKEIKND